MYQFLALLLGGLRMKNVVTKIAAAVFMAASIIHLLNFFIGSVISVGGYIIPSNISGYNMMEVLGFSDLNSSITDCKKPEVIARSL